MTRNKIGILCACLIAICSTPRLVAQTALPVLEISFDGVIERNMAYLNGRMVLTDVDGTQTNLPAKFKTRGATARNYLMKPSLNMKIRTDDYSEEADTALLGMRSCSSWILDAMAIDRICMRNRVAFDIWNEFSTLPYETDFNRRNGTEGRFVEVYINQDYYGIYCLGDRINRKLLNLKKVKVGDEGEPLLRGVLYKSGTNCFENIDNPGYNDDYTACIIDWHNAWELTYPEDYPCEAVWQPLQDAFRNSHSADYVKRYFFLDNLAEYQIHVMALSIVDNWGNKNHFFSIRNMNKDINDPDQTESDRRRIVITPWDLDTSLGGQYDGSCYDGHYTEWPVSAAANNSPYPFYAMGADAEYLDLLKKKWVEGRAGAFSVDNVTAKLRAYRDLFLESGAWQRMVEHFEAHPVRPAYVIDLNREIQQVEEWYKGRFHEMDQYFGISDAIVAPEVAARSTASYTYDLAGRRIDSTRSSDAPTHLPKGFYVRQGKKYIVK